MSFLGIGGGGNIFSSIANVALQGALGVATGGASLLVTTALRGVMLAVGDQVLQQLGQQLGLPQPVIDFAQATFHGAAGDPGGAVMNIQEATQGLGQAGRLSDFDTGRLQQEAFDGAKYVLEEALKAAQDGKDGEGNTKGKALAGAAGKSFLVRLAIAMGSVIDAKQDQMIQKAQEIDEASKSEKSQTAVMSAEMSAMGQEVNFLSNALNTSIKSVGEAAATLSRKS